MKFQIVLHETSTLVELQYGQLDADPYIIYRSQGAGIEDAAGTTGLQIGFGDLASSFAHSGWLSSSVSNGCSATDALSGIASSTCPTVSASAVSLGLGSHSLTATATDEAGNTKTVTTSYTVVLDDTGLCALVYQLSAKPGVANSLCVKIDQIAKAQAKGQTKVATNVLGALDNELRAQSGKALTAAEAALISSLAAQL